ncbi:hypothetical protein [Streptomyces sp. NPDC020917]|uniref:hypothetical protein n=1 Tax=Streptomyces sp. NPDC020917 TaxID=3365102 RepID=UPI0037A43221
MNTTVRTARSSAAAAGGALLLAAAAAVLAPAATAAPADSGPASLAVSSAAPKEIGFAGLPVDFTTKVTNVGVYDTSFAWLHYRIDSGTGVEPNAVSLEYRLSGSVWKKVPLSFADGVFSGDVPESFPLASGKSRTVQMRLGLPMGTPHNGDSNGGTDRLKMTTLVTSGASGAATGEDVDTVKVDGLDVTLSGVPRTAIAGGPGVTFKATVANPSASAYANLTDVLFTNRHTTVEVLRSGRWTELPHITAGNEPDVYGYDIIGKDASLAPHSRTTVTVRLTYREDAPTGTTTVNPCAIINEAKPFLGTAECGAFASITVKAHGSGGSTPTPTATPTPTPSSTTTGATTGGSTTGTTTGATTSGTSGTSGAPTQLAHTGSDGTSTTAAAAAALVIAGGATIGYVGLRRRRG